MGVKYIQSSAAINTVRPKGYRYPVGLSSYSIESAGANRATNSTGGTQTVVGSNTLHTFTTADSFIPGFTGTINVLVVSGGGGSGAGTPGGAGGTGGGGGGGLTFSSGFPVTASSPYPAVIGSGGAAGTVGGAPINQGAQGSPSYFNGPGGIVTTGGGYSPTGPGGSGGGGSGIGGYQSGGSGTPGQGNPGGLTINGGGGGGGAGSAGTSATPGLSNYGWPGGSGLTFFGVEYAGGGGGGTYSGNPNIGIGAGGGGNGGNQAQGTAGAANRGGGAGGTGTYPPQPNGQSGGSGIIIVAYETQDTIITPVYWID